MHGLIDASLVAKDQNTPQKFLTEQSFAEQTANSYLSVFRRMKWTETRMNAMKLLTFCVQNVEYWGLAASDSFIDLTLLKRTFFFLVKARVLAIAMKGSEHGTINVPNVIFKRFPLKHFHYGVFCLFTMFFIHSVELIC